MLKKLQQLWSATKQGITKLLVPHDKNVHPLKCKNWKTLDAQDDITKTLHKHNQKHFGQAQGMPPTVPPLSHQLDFEASTATTEMILEGFYDISVLNKTNNLMVQHLKATAKVDTIPHVMNMTNLTGCLKIWNESTTTSPSGLHLGHWKALITKHPIQINLNQMDQKLRSTNTLIQCRAVYNKYTLTSLTMQQSGATPLSTRGSLSTLWYSRNKETSESIVSKWFTSMKLIIVST